MITALQNCYTEAKNEWMNIHKHLLYDKTERVHIRKVSFLSGMS